MDNGGLSGFVMAGLFSWFLWYLYKPRNVDSVNNLTNQIEQSPLDKAIASAELVLQTEFDKKEGYFYHSMSQLEKDELRATILEVVRNLFSNEDPVAALRQVCVNYAMEIGDLQVLSATPEYAIFKGISGELRTRVGELALIDDHVRKILDELGVLPATQAEMINALNNRANFLNLPFLVFGTIRIVLNDYDRDPTKDWFRPLYISYQIHVEDSYRWKLGMPGALEDRVEAVAYSAFPSLVLGDYKNPREEWERRWVASFNKPSPFAGIAP